MHLDVSCASKISGMTFVLAGIIILLGHLLKCSADSEPEHPSILQRQSLSYQIRSIYSLFTKFFNIPSLTSFFSLVLNI